MKIEIAESLLASWLRHVKECQTVQLNWRASKTWELKNQPVLEALMQRSHALFNEKYAYNVYKASSLTQLIQQAEIDVLGIRLDGTLVQLYAIDVAFHESGLLYGDKRETTERIIKKCLRTAMCTYGYYGVTTADIIFASPKIHGSMLPAIQESVLEMQALLSAVGLDYTVRVIANDVFSEHILQPVVSLLPSIADSNELFVRSLQMYNLFARQQASSKAIKAKTPGKQRPELEVVEGNVLDGIDEMKIGLIARTILRNTLEAGKATPQEIALMQTQEYSRETFNLSFPLLQPAGADFDRVRYYAAPLDIYEDSYYLCSQWYEVPATKHRVFLLRWLAAHL